MRISASFSSVSCLSWLSLLLVLVLVTLAFPSNAAEPTPARKLVLSDRALVVAHRGNSSVAPENTLPAFQSAIAVKSDLVELDYYHSADGVPRFASFLRVRSEHF